MLRRFLALLLVSGSEMLLAVALVLVLALAFVGILTVSFPKGTGLANLYSDLVDGKGRDSNLQMRSGQDDESYVAVLEQVRRHVRDRPADAFTWADAHEGMRLEDHHTIQTLGGSSASIAFGERGQLELGERSLVVVKREEPDRGGRRRHPSVVLLGGKVRGRLAAGESSSSRLDIVTPGGTSELLTRDESGTEFSVTMNDDESATLAVYSGIADINTGSGSLAVGPNEALTYNQDGSVSGRIRIPDAPRLEAPRDGYRETYGPVAPKVELRWRARPGATAYRLELSHDAGFADPIYDEKIEQPVFTHGDLPAGRYFWRVSTVAGRAESLPSAARSFLLRQDLTPPELELDLPDDVVNVDWLVLRGATEAGSELFVGNVPVTVDKDGKFEYGMALERGLNMVVVEVVDEAGNSTYRSQYVTARF